MLVGSLRTPVLNHFLVSLSLARLLMTWGNRAEAFPSTLGNFSNYFLPSPTFRLQRNKSQKGLGGTEDTGEKRIRCGQRRLEYRSGKSWVNTKLSLSKCTGLREAHANMIRDRPGLNRNHTSSIGDLKGGGSPLTQL